MSYAEPNGRACKVSLVVDQNNALQRDWLQTQLALGMGSSPPLSACQMHHLYSRCRMSPCILLWAKHHANVHVSQAIQKQAHVTLMLCSGGGPGLGHQEVQRLLA